MEKYTTIRDALGSFLKQAGLDIQMKNRAVVSAWRKVVGSEIAAQTRMVGFNRGTMTVEVASSSLFAELNTFYLEDLAEAVRNEMGNRKVRKIKLRLGDFVGESGNGAQEHQGRGD